MTSQFTNPKTGSVMNIPDNIEYINVVEPSEDQVGPLQVGQAIWVTTYKLEGDLWCFDGTKQEMVTSELLHFQGA